MSKRIAPRLLSGQSRVRNGHGLPAEIKAGLKAIARHERQSVSWVLEQVIVRYFGLRRPRYKRDPEHVLRRGALRKVS